MSKSPALITKSQEAEVRALYRLMESGPAALVGADGSRLDLPDPVYRAILDLLQHMQQGKAAVPEPMKQQLTTQTAADYLGFSRPFLVKLLEQGDLPFHKVGTHRRIYLADVIQYQRKRDKARKAALNEMARRAFEAGLYDTARIPDGGSDE